MTEIKVQIESIRVEGRYRKNLGDIASLAQSIARDGLIHAITITPGHKLLAGERRLAAVRSLGWTVVEARVVDTLDDAAACLRVERDENTERKAMAPSELVALGRALEELEVPRAAARKSVGRPPRTSGQLAGSSEDVEMPPDQLVVGDTRDIVAAAIGMSATTYRRAKAVVDAASDPAATPEERQIAQEALADMDSEAASVSASHDRIVNQVKARTGRRQATVIVSAKRQRRSISSAEAALSGICHGLQQIVEVDPEITSEEAARWVDSLSESRRIIESLIKRLRERINA